jgi:hypothetical protein
LSEHMERRTTLPTGQQWATIRLAVFRSPQHANR